MYSAWVTSSAIEQRTPNAEAPKERQSALIETRVEFSGKGVRKLMNVTVIRMLESAGVHVCAFHHAVATSFSSSRSRICSRSTNFWIFPVIVIGNASTNITWRGTL